MKLAQEDLDFLHMWFPRLTKLHTTHDLQAFHEKLATIVEAYQALVPPHLVELLQDQPYALVEGSILVADMSGFTALSTQLAQQGRAGSEELSVLINQLLDELISIIYTYGGTILQFSGDSITTLFNQQQLGSHHGLNACAAAQALQKHMQAWKRIKTSSGYVQVQLRITLEQGSTLFIQGQAHQQAQILMTGVALLTAHAAQKYTAPAQVIGGPQIMQATGEQYWEKSTESTWQLKLTPNLSHQVTEFQVHSTIEANYLKQIRLLQPYIAPFIVQRINEGLHTQYGEFRPVSVVFSTFFPTEIFEHIIGTRTPELAYQKVAELFMRLYTTVIDVVERYGGQVNKFDIGEYGHRCIILFGAPVAHEDDAQRAVQATLELQHTFRWLYDDFTPKGAKVFSEAALFGAGITSGVVFAGTVGSPQRHEYTVLGSAVNLASRLHDHSTGEILLDHTTRNIVYAHFDFGEQMTLQFKGLKTPVSVSSVLPTQEYLQSRIFRHTTPLIGRQKEQVQIAAAVQQAFSQKQTQTLVISGNPGTGKSRILEEVLVKAHQYIPDDQVIYLTCQSFEQHVPYAVMRSLLERLPTFSRFLAEQRYDQIVLLLGPWSRFIALFNDILDLGIPETRLTRALPPEQRRERLQEMITDLFRVLQPVCLGINEWQWADASSKAILDYAVQHLNTDALVFAFVERDLETLDAPWLQQEQTHILELTPLSPEESVELATRLLRHAPPPELIPLIEQTGGLPLYIEELIQHLRDINVLDYHHEQWHLHSDTQGSFIPVHHEQLIHARLDQLEPQIRSTAQAAAVLGYEFDSQWLKAFTQEPVQSIQVLTHEHLIQPITASQYQFRSKLLHDTIYQSLLFAQRHTLHLQAAQYLERTYADHPIQMLPILSYHYQSAQHYKEAVSLLLEAGSEAQKQYANLEARELYAQAWQILTSEHVDLNLFDQSLLKLLYLNYADTLILTGNHELALDVYKRSMKTFEHSAYEQAALMRRIATIYEQQTDWTTATNWLMDAMNLLAKLESTPDVQQEQAQTQSTLGWIYFRQGQLETAQVFLQNALNQALASNAISIAASVLNRLGGVAWSLGTQDQAYKYVQQSLEYSRQTQDMVGEAKALGNLGILASQQNLLASAVEFLEKAYALEEQIGNIRSSAIVELNLSRNLFFQGKYAPALEHIQHSIEVLQQFKDMFTIMFALITQAQIQAALSLFDTAEQSIETCINLAQQLERPVTEVEALIIQAQIALSQADLERAEKLGDLAYTKLLKHHDDEQFGKHQRLQAQFAWAKQVYSEAFTLLKENIDYFLSIGLIDEATTSQSLLKTWQDLQAKSA